MFYNLFYGNDKNVFVLLNYIILYQLNMNCF